MAYDLELIRACCKDEAAYQRLFQHLNAETQQQAISQETFARVFRFSPDPIVITRLQDGQALAINDAFVQYTGYSKEEYMTGNPHLWVDRTKRDAMVAQLRREGMIHNLPVELYNKDKRIRHSLLSGEVITYQKEDALLLMVRDVTDYVVTTQKLRDSEERYRRVVQTQTEVICAYTPDMVFTFANDAYCDYFGYTPSTLVGQSILEIIPEEIHARIRRHVAYILETKQSITYESEVKDRHGDWRWMQWVDHPILDDDDHVVEIQAVGRDITDRKQAELQLRLLLDSLSRTAFVMFNHNLEFTTIEGNIFDLIGLSAEAMQGKQPEDIFLEDEVPYAKKLMQRVLAGEEIETDYHFLNRILRLQMYPVYHSATIIGGAVVAENITERREAEQKALQFTLERNRVQLITEFITKAQHEFRTPLSVISSSLYIAERANDREKLIRALLKAQDQVKAISRLVDELTMMARLDAETDIETETTKATNPHYLIQLALDDVTQRAKEKGVALETNFAESLPKLEVYQSLFSHAIVQLLDNAIQHTPDGGTITVSTACEKDWVVISVRDTGEGILPEDIERIFERFYRQDEAHSTRGFGLGLPIAEKIITIHGGTISVESVPEEGSVFTVKVPVK